MKKRNLLLSSLLITVGMVLTIEGLFAAEIGSAPPPAPPAPPLPGAASGCAPCPKAVSKGELEKMLNFARREKLIELKAGVEEVSNAMIKQERPAQPAAEAAQPAAKKPTAAAKSDSAMQAELAERLKKRSLRSSAESTPNASKAETNTTPEEATPMARNLRKSAPARQQNISEKPKEAGNPWGVKLRKTTPPKSALEE